MVRTLIINSFLEDWNWKIIFPFHGYDLMLWMFPETSWNCISFQWIIENTRFHPWCFGLDLSGRTWPKAFWFKADCWKDPFPSWHCGTMKLLNLLLVVLIPTFGQSDPSYKAGGSDVTKVSVKALAEIEAEELVENATDDNVTDENITDEFDEDVTEESITDEPEDQKPEGDLKLRSSLIDRRLGCFQGVACRMLRPQPISKTVSPCPCLVDWSMYINLFWVVFHDWNSLFLKGLASGHVNISLQGPGKASFACPTCFFLKFRLPKLMVLWSRLKRQQFLGEN